MWTLVFYLRLIWKKASLIKDTVGKSGELKKQITQNDLLTRRRCISQITKNNKQNTLLWKKSELATCYCLNNPRLGCKETFDTIVDAEISNTVKPRI